MSSSTPSSPLLHRVLPALLTLLAIFGVPAGTIALFHTVVLAHPLLTLLLALLYEGMILLLGFISRVWENLQSKWVVRVADWCDYWVQTRLSRYRKRYYDYVGYHHRDFDVRGLSIRGTYKLELDQVFVDLSIDTTIIQKATVNPVPQALRQGSHSIWDFLGSLLLHGQHFAIIGPPGSGKTTLLKHIALTMVSQHRSPIPSQRERPQRKLPILLFLRDHTSAIGKAASEDLPFTLIDALHDHLKKWGQPLPPPGWFQRQLQLGRCLVLLDGLDEVADAQLREHVVDWVKQQTVAYHNNRFLVTSRPFGFRSAPIDNFTTLEVQPFTPAQVEQFVSKWYLAHEIMSKQKDDSGVQMMARVGAREFLQQLRGKLALFALTVNPLLLTMMTTIHYNGGRLPEKRVTLYSEICTVFLGSRQKARGIELALTPEQIQLVLEPLAYHMMQNNKRDIALDEVRRVIREPLSRVSTVMTAEAFLQLVENASGLLFERESGSYSFAHLTFQEFLAATYMREKSLGDLLVARVKDPWWQETIRLYCAMADATRLIAACLQGERPSAAAFELAIDCDTEARDVEPAIRAKLNALIERGKEDSDPQRQHVVAAALLARRLRAMVHLKEETYLDTSLITCAEYQLFLDEQRGRGNYLQPDHWTSYRFPPGASNTPVLGVRRSDAEAFCQWLTALEPGWQYRLPRAGELEGESIYDRLPGGSGYWLLNAQGFAWARKAIKLPNNVLQELMATLFYRNLNRDLDRTIALDLDLVYELNLPNALALRRDLDLVHELTFPSALAHTIDRVLSRAIDFDRDIGLVHARGLAIAIARAYTTFPSDLNRARALDLAHTIDRAFAHTINRAFAHTIDRAFARTIDLDIARTIAWGLVQIFSGKVTRATSLAMAQALFRDYVASLLFSHQLERASLTRTQQHFSLSSAGKREQNELQRFIEALLSTGYREFVPSLRSNCSTV